LSVTFDFRFKETFLRYSIRYSICVYLRAFVIFMKLVITLKSQEKLSIVLVSPLVTLNSNEFGESRNTVGLPSNTRMELGTRSDHIVTQIRPQ